MSVQRRSKNFILEIWVSLSTAISSVVVLRFLSPLFSIFQITIHPASFSQQIPPFNNYWRYSFISLSDKHDSPLICLHSFRSGLSPKCSRFSWFILCLTYTKFSCFVWSSANIVVDLSTKSANITSSTYACQIVASTIDLSEHECMQRRYDTVHYDLYQTTLHSMTSVDLWGCVTNLSMRSCLLQYQ